VSIAKFSARSETPSFYPWFAENATNLAEEAADVGILLKVGAGRVLSFGRMAILGKKPSS
jgi:hypothetical protein